MSPELTWKPLPSFRQNNSGLFHASFGLVLKLSSLNWEPSFVPLSVYLYWAEDPKVQLIQEKEAQNISRWSQQRKGAKTPGWAGDLTAEVCREVKWAFCSLATASSCPALAAWDSGQRSAPLDEVDPCCEAEILPMQSLLVQHSGSESTCWLALLAEGNQAMLCCLLYWKAGLHCPLLCPLCRVIFSSEPQG